MSELNGSSVLLLEDEYLIAMDAEQILLALGAAKVAIAGTIAEAEQLAKAERYDLAMLDVNINGESSFSLAEMLRARDIPVVFATGYDMRDRSVPDNAAAVIKPYTSDSLKAALSTALQARAK
jgi:CheY-like chemotaxis protein